MTDERNVLSFLQERYPFLRGESLRISEYGWSNQVVFAGEKLIFRFPRGEESLEAMRREQKLLPFLEARLPLPVPHFLYQSEATDAIQYVGYELLPGQPLTPELFQTLPDEQKENLARDLGAFLSALHTFDANPYLVDSHALAQERAQDKWLPFYREIEEKVFPLLERQEQEWTRDVFAGFLKEDAHFEWKPCLLHADFTSDHLLYDVEKGKLGGVIDFGDMELGDPAYDFVGLYVEYGEAFMKRVLDEYTAPIDRTFLHRIESFYRERMPFHGLLRALETDQPHLLQTHLKRLRTLIV